MMIKKKIASTKSYKFGGLLPTNDIQQKMDPTNWDFSLSTDSSCPSKVLLFLPLQICYIKQRWSHVPNSNSKSFGVLLPILKYSFHRFRHKPFYSRNYKHTIPLLHGIWTIQYQMVPQLLLLHIQTLFTTTIPCLIRLSTARIFPKTTVHTTLIGAFRSPDCLPWKV